MVVMVVRVVMRAQVEALAHCVLKLLPQRAAGQSPLADDLDVRRDVPEGGAAALPVPATPRT